MCCYLYTNISFGKNTGAWGQEPGEGETANVDFVNRTIREVYESPYCTHFRMFGMTLAAAGAGGIVGTCACACPCGCGCAWLMLASLRWRTWDCWTGPLSAFLSWYILYGFGFVFIMLGFCRIGVREEAA